MAKVKKSDWPWRGMWLAGSVIVLILGIRDGSNLMQIPAALSLVFCGEFLGDKREE